MPSSSELPLGLGASTACWGCWEGWQDRKGPESWTSRKGSATRQGPWPGHKAADVVFRETRPHCAREPSPAESRLGTATNGLSEHKMRILLPLCKWLLPSGAQQVPDPSQGSVVSRGRVERSRSVPLESGASFSLAATVSRLGFPPICLSAPDLSLPLC